MKTVYVAGWNMPGYLPECDPETFERFEEAKGYIIDTLKTYEDEEGTGGNEDAAENFCHAAEDVNLESRPFSVVANGLAFWIAEEGE